MNKSKVESSKSKVIAVGDEDTDQRLDIFLSEKLAISRSQAQKLIKAGSVRLNNETPKKVGQKLKTGDQVTINQAEDKLADNMAWELDIVAETKNYLIVNKPCGLLTHAVESKSEQSLAGLLAEKYPEIKTVGDEPSLRPGIVHRLDKDASGLLVVARTQAMFDHLKKQFKTRQVEKEYAVLVHGTVEAAHDKINFPIARSKNSDRMAALPPTSKGIKTDEGRAASTEFWVEKSFVNFTLLKVKTHTGRPHQIRVHLLAYGHPLVGDKLYYNKKQKRKWDDELGRLFLHCNRLGFNDLDGAKQEFSSPRPADLEKFLKKIK